ncbi:class I SAM-dependent methyltransferase [Actinoplanes sp. NPDC049596]|uniref:class I SAM-dependent methyltransferase n=1 Tax=unclassified Actinoplanes TaxID=2626549 RepID=UPI003437997D
MTDWVQWHAEYEIPGSSLARRLSVVQEHIRAVLPSQPRVISMCAGDGRDVLPLLPPDASGILVELDPSLSRQAEAQAARLGLRHLAVRNEDAGRIDAYLSAAPASLVLACGVFGNVSDDDVRRTIEALPTLLDEGGHVIWTRAGASAAFVRECFAASGFEEVAFTEPADAKFRVGTHRLSADPRPPIPGTRLFDFVN